MYVKIQFTGSFTVQHWLFIDLIPILHEFFFIFCAPKLRIRKAEWWDVHAGDLWRMGWLGWWLWPWLVDEREKTSFFMWFLFFDLILNWSIEFPLAKTDFFQAGTIKWWHCGCRMFGWRLCCPSAAGTPDPAPSPKWSPIGHAGKRSSKAPCVFCANTNSTDSTSTGSFRGCEAAEKTTRTISTFSYR